MYAIEDAGLLKFDFLGIRNLAILGEAVRLVKKIYGTDVDIEKFLLTTKKLSLCSPAARLPDSSN